MKYTIIVVILALLIGALTGCGGGSGAGSPKRDTTIVTIVIKWPDAGRSAGRVYPQAVNSISLEVFLGTTRVSRTSIQRIANSSQSSVPLALPSGALTFYANAYTDTQQAPDYPTNPATGLPTFPPGVTDYPVARGVATLNVPAPNNTITFTMNNTIVSLAPYSPQPIEVNLSAGTLPLSNVLIALDQQGDIVMSPALPSTTAALPNSALVWTTDPTDKLASYKGTIGGTSSAPVLNLLGAGTLKLYATQQPSEVNPGQPQIQTVVAVQIDPAPAVTVTTTVTNIPLYAKSVTLTLTQDAFDLGVNTPPLDSPPTQPPITPAPVTITQLTAGATASTATITVSYQPTGRKLHLAITAWSHADGSGALVAQLQQDNPTFPFTAALQSNVAGFDVTPISGFIGTSTNPQLYQTVAGSATTPTSGTLQAALVVNGPNNTVIHTGEVVAPTTLNWSAATAAIAAVNGSGVVTSGGMVGTVTITAADKANAAINGTIPVTVLANTGTANLTVN